MRILLTLLLLPFFTIAQNVGINTNSPNATLDIVSSTRTNDFDGILIPRVTELSASLTSSQDGMMVFLISDWNDGSKIWERGFYNWNDDSSTWNIFYTDKNHNKSDIIGDVKSGFQQIDHNGWYLLDGRAVNTLNTNVQAAANSIGFTANIPDATNKVLKQHNVIGATGGNTSNELIISQSNLPNVNFTGNTNLSGNHNHIASSGNTGSHNHTATASTTGNHNHSGSTGAAGTHNHNYYTATHNTNGSDSQGYPAGNNHIAFRTTDRRQETRNNGTIQNNGNHTHSVSISTAGNHSHSISVANNGNHTHPITVNNNGEHSHTASVNSGGTGVPLIITPEFIGVNMFIYLGQ